MAITVSRTGYIKRTAISTYRNQRRGGKGRIGMRTRDEDFVSHLFVASTHSYIMIFSDRGRAYWLKVHEIPDVGPGGKGKSIANLVSMEEGEKIAAMLAVKEFEDDKFVVMGTRKGVIKKTALSAFSNPRAGGIIAMGVEEGDAVIAVLGHRRQGRDLHRHARRHGHPLRGGRRPADGPRRRTAFAASRSATTTTWWRWKWCSPAARCSRSPSSGYGKRTEIDEYRVQSRGGVGIINISTSDRNGHVVGVACVQEGDELLLITQQGMIIRMPTNDVRAIGRATQGVRLIDVEDDDQVVSVARLVEKEDESDTGPVTRRRDRRSAVWSAAIALVSRGCVRHPAEKALVDQFFSASRLRRSDRGAIHRHGVLRSQGPGARPQTSRSGASRRKRRAAASSSKNVTLRASVESLDGVKAEKTIFMTMQREAGRRVDDYGRMVTVRLAAVTAILHVHRR